MAVWDSGLDTKPCWPRSRVCWDPEVLDSFFWFSFAPMVSGNVSLWVGKGGLRSGFCFREWRVPLCGLGLSQLRTGWGGAGG